MVLHWVLCQSGYKVSSFVHDMHSRGRASELLGLAQWREAGDAVEVFSSYLVCYFLSLKKSVEDSDIYIEMPFLSSPARRFTKFAMKQ